MILEVLGEGRSGLDGAGDGAGWRQFDRRSYGPEGQPEQRTGPGNCTT